MVKKRLSFLLVEDDDNHAHLVVRSLDKARLANTIDRVADGVEAMAFLRKQGMYATKPRPDVVLLDLKLPRMTGHEVLEAIRSDENLKQIPVVVMSTSDTENDRARAYAHFANSYVVKPADYGTFRRMVSDVCRYWGGWNEPPVCI